MIFLPNLSKRLFLLAWLMSFLMLFFLTSCNLTPDTQGKTTTPGTSTLVTTPATTYSSLPGARPFIDTWNGIHLFQSFDFDIDNPSAIASYYDFVWGASPDKVASFRSSNPNIFLSYYFSFFRDSGTFGHQGTGHSLAYWQKVHPDWILYKCDRKTPAYEDALPNVPFNFTNPAVISWEVQTYAMPASKNGYDAIAADNVNMENLIGACGYYNNGHWVQRYTGKTDDPQWRADVATWVVSMQKALRRLPHPLALIPNLGLSPSFSPDDPALQQVVNHVDGILDEAGFTQYAQSYLTGNQWLQKVNFIQSMQQLHKPYFIVNEFPTASVDRSDIQWALASYLMCKGHAAYISITPTIDHQQGYGVDLRYNEYNAQIGSPLAAMVKEQQVYWRRYSHGLSLVNPSPNNTYTVTLPRGENFVDLYGKKITQQVTLPPHSGLVLLTTP
jgi:hypothetical protein